MERKLIAAAVSSALALPMAAQAVEFSISGHVNRAIISVDDGSDENDGNLRHVDANSSATRFRIKGSEELDSGMTVGVYWEVDKIGNESAPFRARQANVYLSTAGGKLTLGQASTAADGMAHARLGGPSWLGGVTNWCSYAGGSTACPSNDGNRHEVVRYDTPAIGPASLAVSAGSDDYWDAKLSIAGSMGDAGYDLRVGYVGENTLDSSMSDVTTASGAVSFGQGTAVAAAWSQNDGSGNEYAYVELDHSYGDGSVGVYFKDGETNGVDGSLWGIGVGHSLGGGATAYAGYRLMEQDGAEDTTLLVAGMRVTFN